MKERPTSKNIDFPLPLPTPWGILLAYFPKSVRVNRQIGHHSGITKSLSDATTAADFLFIVYPLWRACQQQKPHKNTYLWMGFSSKTYAKDSIGYIGGT
jgi:hypothetical protein